MILLSMSLIIFLGFSDKNTVSSRKFMGHRWISLSRALSWCKNILKTMVHGSAIY